MRQIIALRLSTSVSTVNQIAFHAICFNPFKLQHAAVRCQCEVLNSIGLFDDLHAVRLFDSGGAGRSGESNELCPVSWSREIS